MAEEPETGQQLEYSLFFENVSFANALISHKLFKNKETLQRVNPKWDKFA